MVVVAYGLIVLGFLALIVGIGGAAIVMWSSRGKGFAATTAQVIDIIKALPELLKVILTSPQWLLLMAFGAGLVWSGIYLLQGGVVAQG